MEEGTVWEMVYSLDEMMKLVFTQKQFGLTNKNKEIKVKRRKIKKARVMLA